MRRDGERVVVETLMDGRVAADAGAIGRGDGLTDMYRHLNKSQLPITLGGWASQDVVGGLKDIAEMDMNVGGYLDSNIAKGYLSFLGVEVDS